MHRTRTNTEIPENVSETGGKKKKKYFTKHTVNLRVST